MNMHACNSQNMRFQAGGSVPFASLSDGHKICRKLGAPLVRVAMLHSAETAARVGGGVRFGGPTASLAQERELVMQQVLPSMAASVTIQEGWQPGQQIECRMPNGSTVPFKVPAGSKAGEQYSLDGDTLMMPDIRPQIDAIWKGRRGPEVAAGCTSPVGQMIVKWLLEVIASQDGYDWLAEEDADGGAGDPGVPWNQGMESVNDQLRQFTHTSAHIRRTLRMIVCHDEQVSSGSHGKSFSDFLPRSSGSRSTIHGPKHASSLPSLRRCSRSPPTKTLR